MAKKDGPIPPTPEQLRRHRFDVEAVHDRLPNGTLDLKGTAYRRKPHFETLGLGEDERRALTFYRRQFDRTERSEMRCALDVRPGGGAGEGPSPGYLHAREMLGICESSVAGDLLATLRAVALFDCSFSDVALARYGGRKQNWLEMEKDRPTDRKGRKMVFVDKVVPNSGRRQQIAEEFRMAVEAVTAQLKPYLRTGD